MGVPCVALGLNRKSHWVSGLYTLWRECRIYKPQIVQTWMYHADFLGGLIARLSGRRPLFWSLHSGTVPSTESSKKTRVLVRALAFLSHILPEKIVSCSQAGVVAHGLAGYDRDRFVFVPNGIDPERFVPNLSLGFQVREELGWAKDDFVIGCFARYHPQKNILGLLRVAACLPHVRFLLCGDGVDWNNPALTSLISEGRPSTRFKLLGPREDIPRLMAAVNTVVLPSLFGEAFPLVLLEAMSMEIPCVASDVGDCAFIIGETGIIVRCGDHQELVNALRKMAEMPDSLRQRMGRAARERILNHFTVERVVSAYADLYKGSLRKAKNLVSVDRISCR